MKTFGPSAVSSVFFPAHGGEIIELHIFLLILNSNVIAIIIIIIIKRAVLELNIRMIAISPPQLTSVFKFSAKERVIPTSRHVSHRLIT
jgi:hypothetical protein